MIPLANPSDSGIFTCEWEDTLNGVLTLVSVTHTVPSPLTKVSEATDTANDTSQVRVSGGVHGGLYQITAAATMDNGEVLTRAFPLRMFNG